MGTRTPECGTAAGDRPVVPAKLAGVRRGEQGAATEEPFHGPREPGPSCPGVVGVVGGGTLSARTSNTAAPGVSRVRR